MDRKWDYPQFSMAERDRRWKGIRSAMLKRGIDCLLIYGDSGLWDSFTADMRYVTQIGRSGEEGMVVFPLEGEVTVCPNFPSPNRFFRENSQDWVKDVRGGYKKGEDPAGLAIARVKELGLEKGRIGVTGIGGLSAPNGRLPHNVYLMIEAAFPNIVNATEIIEEMRLIKSAEEIAFIEKAVEISDLAIDTIVEKTRPGMKGYEIYAEAMHTIFKNGSEHPMFLFDHGPSQWHSAPIADARPIQKGDVILAVISPRYCGYFGHAHQTFSLGEPRKEYFRLFETALKSLENGLAALKPGITVQEASDAFVAPILKAGYYWCNPLFHGIGLKLPDYPQACKSGVTKTPQGPMILQEGMVLGLEGTTNLYEEGLGVSIGNAAVITATGARYLSKRKPEFIKINPR